MDASRPDGFPFMRFLSRGDRERIHGAVCHILDRIGMRVFHEEAAVLLEKAGCRIEDGTRVHIPEAVLRTAMESVPRSIPVHDREGAPAMDLGGTRSYFGPGSDLLYAVNGGTLERHRCRIEDVARAARVCDALPNIDFVMSFAHPADIPPHHAYLGSFRAMVENSSKPIVTTAEDRGDLHEMWALAAEARGGEDALRRQPYILHYAEPTSPLKHPFSSVDKLLLCADKGIPLVYSPAPIAGSTAPMTMAGHVAQGVAECFCGLVIHQLRAPGAPFLMGMGPAVLDMATAQCSYNAPEYYLSYVALVEMSHHYDIPNWGYAGTSDSQIPDGQAAVEAGVLTFISTMIGSNLNHDVGYLDFGRTGSLEMIVILDELIDQARRLKRGVPVDEDTLALDVIAQVSERGSFLEHAHTLRHFASTQWRPKLLNRQGFQEWEQKGSAGLLDRASRKLKRILETHEPAPVPPSLALALEERTIRFKVGPAA
ncbi:MAG: trimethylamine methyltransferase family protein [Deltaproteobacteria bacterium]|nr:trimethylamine methyltransferase family protein [Deltaproteobacteria bacterium]